MERTYDTKWKVTEPSCRCNGNEGEYRSMYGLATFIKDESYLRIDFIYQGYWYMREYNRGYTNRGATIMTGKFIKEIVALSAL